MNKHFAALTLSIATCFLWSSALGLGVVRDFQGSSSIMTADFLVKAPWLLDWRVNSEYSKVMGLEIDLIDARTGLHAGRVLKTRYVGNGVKLFNEGGRYRLRVNASLVRWRIKIEEISKEDAELYTPRSGN